MATRASTEAECPTPAFHRTHHYCPSCPWQGETLRERMERHGPLVYARNMGADEPVFHRILENDDGDMFPVCDASDQARRTFWSPMHVKHASRIGAACDVCFPATNEGAAAMSTENDTETSSWFHWHGGIFFRRATDGSVEMGEGTNFDDVTVVHSIDPSSWASIVSNVSYRGEDHETFHEAFRFHQGESAG